MNKEPSKGTWKVWGRFLCFYCAINPSKTKLIYFRCTCGNCQILNRNEECTYCSEFPEICNKNREAVEMGEVAEAPVCITQHPGFQAVCLNRWVLQTAWYQYRQYSQSYEDPPKKTQQALSLSPTCQMVLGCSSQRNKSPFVIMCRCVAFEHTFVLWDLKTTSSSSVFIFQMNKKQQVHMLTQKGCTLCA